MKNAFTVAGKELYRFFSDSRMIFSSIILPAILIYTLYSLTGMGISNSTNVKEDYNYTIYYNYDYYLNNIVKETIPDVNFLKCENVNLTKKYISDKSADILIVYPEDIDKAINGEKLTLTPEIEIYFNSLSNESLYAYNLIKTAFENYESNIYDIFSINQSGSFDMALKKDITATFLSQLMPMLIIMFSFSSCTGAAAEAIAGEKERKTLSTVFMSPVRTWQFAIGKVMGLSVISLLGAFSSFLGIVLSVGKIMPQSENTVKLNWSIYSLNQYLLMLAIIVSVVLLIVSVVSFISSLSKTIQEASSYMQPLTILASAIAMSPMFIDTPKSFMFLIPIFNSAQMFNAIFSLNYSYTSFCITVFSNIFYSILFVVLMSKVMKSDKMMN